MNLHHVLFSLFSFHQFLELLEINAPESKYYVQLEKSEYVSRYFTHHCQHPLSRSFFESHSHSFLEKDFCEAQGKGRARGGPRKVTQRSFMDGGWWMVVYLSLMLYIKVGCHHPPPPTTTHHHP